MQHSTSPAQLDRYRRYFAGPHLDLVVDSVLAGNTQGELWTLPTSSASPLLLLWDRGNNVFYLAGESHDRSSLDSLAAVVDRELQPRAFAARVSRFKARALSPSLEQSLPDLFRGIVLSKLCTLFYLHDPSQRGSVAPADVPDVAYLPISRALLKPGRLAHSNDVRTEIASMWPSEARFFEQGFGIVAVLEGEIISWCTAEYVSPTRCGIGIATSPQYQRRGVATATADRFVREAHCRGIAPYWECTRTNRGSIRVAEKVGFARPIEETYWIGSFTFTAPPRSRD